MRIKYRLLAVIAITAILSIAISVSIMNKISTDIVARWTQELVEREVIRNTERAIQPIVREITLAKNLAQSRIITRWASEPEKPEHLEAAIAHLNEYRKRFSDQSYFATLLANNSYYHNNADNQFPSTDPQYILDPENPADAWFYASLEKPNPVNLNVDHDRFLKVSKLWINVQIRDENQALGVIGTGFDLSSFIDSYVYDQDPSFATLFLDQDGAIQLTTNSKEIVRASVAKTSQEKILVFDYIQSLSEKNALRTAFDSSKRSPNRVEIVPLSWEGSEKLVGVTYVPALNWYNLTVVDIQSVLSVKDFYALYMMVALAVTILMVSIYFAVNQYLDKPLRYLNQRIDQMSHQDTPRFADTSVLRLPKEFLELSDRLESFAFYDGQTGLYNRRGLGATAALELANAQRHQWSISLAILDIDHFKQFNDSFGHPAGDTAIKVVAELLQRHFQRATDIVARYGGEEFVIVASNLSSSEMQARIEVCRNELKQTDLYFRSKPLASHLTISAGGVTKESTNDRETDLRELIDRADEQLYLAKRSRDTLRWSLL